MALFQTLAALEDLTGEVYATVGNQLSSTVLTASDKSELGLLLTELVSLREVLRQLDEAAVGLGEKASIDSRSDQHEESFIDPSLGLAYCFGNKLRTLELQLATVLTIPAILETTALLTGFRSRFAFAINNSATFDDIVQHLSFGAEGFDDHAAAVRAAASQAPSAASVGSGDLSNPTAEEISAWLDMFNSPGFNREPDNYFQETLTLRTLRQRVPQYSEAASRWPDYAEKYWLTLETPINTLFQTPSSFNFIQWALEYGREKHRDSLGCDASSPDTLVDLTDALCQGSVSTLHVAAALGLPSLCSVLLSETTKARKYTGSFGTPLLWALLGPRALGARAAGDHFNFTLFASWMPESDSCEGRADTVALLIDAGADCKYNYRWTYAGEASLAGPAFWASIRTKKVSIFRRVVAGGAALDSSFRRLVANLSALRVKGPIVARLLTIALDYSLRALADSTSSWNNWTFPPVRQTIRKWMDGHHKTFVFGNESPRLQGVLDARFTELVTGAVSEGETFIVRRLVHDPRFKIEMRFDGGTLLHLAVELNRLDMVDFLIDRGADLTAVDDEGRTVLMLVESPDMLSKLVVDHGVSTKAVDYIGRNIWHFIASSNDLDCLAWLCENDPHKDENLVAKARNSNTPLAEAFHFLRDLPAEGRTPMSAKPSTARILLQECKDPACLSSETPLTHIAVSWGELDLIESLVALGADFGVRDQHGRSPLHFLNLTATPSFVARLQELCDDSHIEDSLGFTPVEAIIANTALLFQSSSDPIPTSAWADGVRTFHQVVTPEIIKFRDQKARNCLERFCAGVFQPRYFEWGNEHLEAAFWQYVMGAMHCLGGLGVMRDYEVEKGQTSALALRPWIMDDSRHVVLLLVMSDRSLVAAFYESPEAIELLARQARGCASLDCIKLLCSRGVPRHLAPADSSGEYGSTPLEAAIMQTNQWGYQMVEMLLDGLPLADLKERRIQIFVAAFRSQAKDRVEVLHILLDKGLDPNSAQGGGDPALLDDEISNLDQPMREALLEKGHYRSLRRGTARPGDPA